METIPIEFWDPEMLGKNQDDGNVHCSKWRRDDKRVEKWGINEELMIEEQTIRFQTQIPLGIGTTLTFIIEVELSNQSDIILASSKNFRILWKYLKQKNCNFISVIYFCHGANRIIYECYHPVILF